ncbi:MAG: hypothetical protein V3U58_04590, partial [Thermodesulfobacteriota bacterium]
MSAIKDEARTIHLSEIDEFLASALLDIEETPFRISVSKIGVQGYITIAHGKTTTRIREGGI